MKVKILTQSFDPWQEIQEFQNMATAIRGKAGANNIFIGTLRDFNEGSDIKAMTLEHYPGMTEKQLCYIVDEAMKKWKIIDILVLHRVGELFPGDPIVLIAVWSSHRGDAFDSSRFIMEALKSKVPFWKKEVLASNDERWVEKNSNGYLQSQ